MIAIIVRHFKKITIGFLVAGVISSGFFAVVHAGYDYTGTVYGRTEWHGYFTNNLDTQGIEVLPAISGGQAIPNYVNTVGELIALLKAANTSGNYQKNAGSGFIVNTMLGRKGPGGGRNVSAADWTDLTNRLNDRQSAGKISWTGNVSNSYNSYYQGDTTKDDAHYWEYHNEAGIRIFNDDGSIAYELLRRCANPMGNTPGVPLKVKDVPPPKGGPGGVAESSLGCQPMVVKLTPATDFNGKGIPTNVSTNLPQNLGTYSTYKSIDITATHTTGDIYTVTYKETANWISSYKAVKNAKGTIIRWDPVYSAARSYTSTIGPCYGYQLTPSIIVNFSSGIIEPGSQYNVSATVTNGTSGGYATKSKSTQWQLSKLVIPAGPATVPIVAAPGILNAAPCTANVYVPNGSGINCANFANGTQVFAKSSPTSVYNQNLVAEDQPVGTRICYGLSVIPNASTMPVVLSQDAYWRHTQPSPQTKCLIIGKKPKVQVLGGDLSVGKALAAAAANSGATVQTSTTDKITSMVPGGPLFTFGSWIEYAIYATGNIIGAASGSYYADSANGIPYVAPCPTVDRTLSFTLAVSPTPCGPIGGYVQTRSIPDFAASYAGSGVVKPAGSTLSTSSLTNSASKIYSVAGDLTLSDNLALDHSVILKVAGTLTIAGDQKYASGPYIRTSQLPQLVIIAKDINIDPGVNQVDGWLMATGIVNTCSDGGTTGNLTSGICDNQLVINGPIMAKKLYLRRTFGAEADVGSGTPAEIINLRSDAYLWAQYQAASSGRVQTVYTTELPPRI